LTLSFRGAYAEKILKGEKTMTRRLRKPLVKPNKTYPLRVGRRSIPGEIKIKEIYCQRLGDMDDEDLVKEGFATFEDFKKDWIEIYRFWDEDTIVWVVEFEYLPKGYGA